MVGAEGFEPPTLCSQSRCATRLRHAPMPDRPLTSGAAMLSGWRRNVIKCDRNVREFRRLRIVGQGRKHRGKSPVGAHLLKFSQRTMHPVAFGCRALRRKVMSTGCPSRCPPDDAFWQAKLSGCGFENPSAHVSRFRCFHSPAERSTLHPVSYQDTVNGDQVIRPPWPLTLLPHGLEAGIQVYFLRSDPHAPSCKWHGHAVASLDWSQAIDIIHDENVDMCASLAGYG